MVGKFPMDIENLRKLSEESRLRNEQRGRDESLRREQEQNEQRHQWEVEFQKRAAAIPEVVRERLELAARQGERECLLSFEHHVTLWDRRIFGGASLHANPLTRYKQALVLLM